MTKLSPAVIAAVFLVYVLPLQAQVKDTYQDQSNALTTIVVKEDSASDMAILQQQFDLDEIGMHQVIRITTRPNTAAPKLEESLIDSAVLAEKSSMIAHAEPNTTPKEAPVLASPAPTQQEATTSSEKSSHALPATPKEEGVTQKNQRYSSSSSGSSTRSKGSQKQTKASNKRFKKEKRKYVSKRNNRMARCYKF